MDTQNKPLLPLTWWGVLIRVIIGTIWLAAANFARVPLHHWAERRWTEEEAQLAAASLIFLITPLIVVAGVVAWMRWVEGVSISVTGLTRWRSLLPGFVGGLALVALAIIPAWVLLAALQTGAAEIPNLDGRDVEQVPLGLLLILLFVRAVLLQGLPEELIYRGWFFHVTRNRPWLTLAWTTLAFTVIHLVSSGGQQSLSDHVWYLAMPFGMAVLGGAVVLWRGSVWWAVGTHGGMHIWLAVASAVHPLDLGTVAWVMLGVAQLLVGAVILALWHRRRAPHSTEF
ncbi:MAG: CPBP family intramembrane metalloprotease [Corynebacterium sp.]|uniref:CPBP family intramembrane glutamic endopeptidase n=1 Tax=Corynebacterium sp. TaxID=1720 RepID=UPI0026DF0918|nr:CPBP family intramembrane glutamic endopeptidase [Corynebacterium sp.]MDO5669642.1 CPBP family intramembrane metalloprotease [Corynebacterium sp.]